MTEAANMTREFVHYRQLERRLWLIRWRNAGEESVEEDEVLDEMDRTWTQLSEREQAILSCERKGRAVGPWTLRHCRRNSPMPGG